MSVDVVAPIVAESRLCRGPAHPNPTWLPLDARHWSFYRSGPRQGRPLGHCKLCHHWHVLKVQGGPHGLAEVESFSRFARELVDRCGTWDAAVRRSGLTETTLRSIAEKRQAQVRLATGRKLLVALAEQRKVDRRNGASMRFVKAKQAQARHEERLWRMAGY